MKIKSYNVESYSDFKKLEETLNLYYDVNNSFKKEYTYKFFENWKRGYLNIDINNERWWILTTFKIEGNER